MYTLTMHLSRPLKFSLALLAAPVALATSFYEQPFPDAVKDAPVIVRGKVGEETTDWSTAEDGNKRIYTFFEFQVAEVLKGSADPKVLRMRELGGEKDGRGMHVAGAAHFSQGEDVVVFLGERNDDGSHDVFGMMMGKYEIKKDLDGSEYLAGPGINSLSDTHGVIRTHEDLKGQTGTPGTKKWTLESLRTLIASQGDRPKPRDTVSKPVALPPVTPTPEALPPQPELGETTAPQLQSQLATGSWGLGLAFGGAALTVLLWLVRRRRRR